MNTKWIMDNKEAQAIALELAFMDSAAQAALAGTDEQANRYAAATRRARRLWLAPAIPLPLP